MRLEEQIKNYEDVQKYICKSTMEWNNWKKGNYSRGDRQHNWKK